MKTLLTTFDDLKGKIIKNSYFCKNEDDIIFEFDDETFCIIESDGAEGVDIKQNIRDDERFGLGLLTQQQEKDRLEEFRNSREALDKERNIRAAKSVIEKYPEEFK